MAFDRFQELGEEKFTKILNMLMRGEACVKIARELQAQPPAGWGLFQDVSEWGLRQQLNRLRTAAAEGVLGRRRAKEMADGHKPNLRLLEKVSPRVLDRMEELADLQRERVFRLTEREKISLLPDASVKMAPQEYRHLLTQTNLVFSEYRQVLLDLQEIRFKLGLDEYKGPVTGAVRGAVQTTTFPDGMSVQKQVFEAVQTVERILDARQIPQTTPRG